MALYGLGRYDDAGDEIGRAANVIVAELGPRHPATATAQSNLATIRQAQQRPEEALELYEQARETWLAVLGPEHPNTASIESNIGLVLMAQKRFDEAAVQFKRALDITEHAHGDRHPNNAVFLANLALCYEQMDRMDEALELHRRALELRESRLGPEHPELAFARYRLANLLLETGRPRAGLPLAEAAWARLQRPDVPDMHRVISAYVLAQILVELDEDRARALELGEYAVRELPELGPRWIEDAEAARAWLDEAKSR
jgi:tetratricopeptide (TPR) repeat protein